MNQQQIFEQWNMVCSRLKSIGAIVQNDFDKQVSDGMTRNDLKKELADFDSTFWVSLRELKDLRQAICDLIEQY